MLNENQTAQLLTVLHAKRISERQAALDDSIKYFGLNEVEKETEKNKVLCVFKNGIECLNTAQLRNLIELIETDSIDGLKKAKEKLLFYQIEQNYYTNILSYLENFVESGKAITDTELAENFKGVQVATTDDFNTLLKQGFSGYWELNPDNVNPLKLQIASMNHSGTFSRGFVILADIERFDKVDDKRYRIYFSAPIIINTGNRNIKFGQNPVRYFK